MIPRSCRQEPGRLALLRAKPAITGPKRRKITLYRSLPPSGDTRACAGRAQKSRSQPKRKLRDGFPKDPRLPIDDR